MPVTALKFAHSPIFYAAFTANPGNITSGAFLEVTVTVTGLTTDMLPNVVGPNLEAGIYVLGAKITAANTLKFLLYNSTVGAVDPASQTFFVRCL